MSARSETAAALIELVLSRLTQHTQWRAESRALQQAIDLLKPTASAIRMRRMRSKCDAESDVTSDADVTPRTASRSPSRALPSELSTTENSSDSLNALKEEKHASMLSQKRASSAPEVTSDVTLAVTHEIVSREWHAAMATAGASGLHAAHAWRADYETIAAACAAVDGDPLTAVVAVCRWFWLAPDGPVKAGRVRMHFATPGHLAKRVSTDLLAAAAWWANQQEAAQ
jgi:hypothetical protein